MRIADGQFLRTVFLVVSECGRRDRETVITAGDIQRSNITPVDQRSLAYLARIDDSCTEVNGCRYGIFHILQFGYSHIAVTCSVIGMEVETQITGCLFQLLVAGILPIILIRLSMLPADRGPITAVCTLLNIEEIVLSRLCIFTRASSSHLIETIIAVNIDEVKG